MKTNKIWINSIIISISFIFLIFSPINQYLYAQENTSRVRIERDGERFRIIRNGEPYFIKGVCGSEHLNLLLENGGNSIRLFSPRNTITSLNERNLTVMVGLRMGKPRQGFDYTNREQVKRQLDRNLEVVQNYMSDPAVLMWAIGNETEAAASKEERIQIWTAVEETARAIKAIDNSHPVIVVIATVNFFNQKLTEIKQICPSLDAIGINAYGNIFNVPEEIRKAQWDRAYIITEFGPRGHWEVEKTAWGMPIEDNSTVKADYYLNGYNHTVKDPLCLGSYVFLWGQKQEKTHTWYGMFLPDGSQLGPIDTIAHGWTGTWPVNSCPVIGPDGVTITPQSSASHNSQGTFSPGTRLNCLLDVTDPDGNPVTVTWDMRIDVSDNPSMGGDPERSTPPIDGAVISVDGDRAVLQVPAKPGLYRIFAYAHDPGGKAATANVPILVQ